MEHSFSFTLSSSFHHSLFLLASFDCHMSVFHLALRFICMYVFTSFSHWVCTDIYIYRNRYELSLSSTFHPSIFLSVFLYITPNHPILLSVKILKAAMAGGMRDIYMYSYVHVSHIECGTWKVS